MPKEPSDDALDRPEYLRTYLAKLAPEKRRIEEIACSAIQREIERETDSTVREYMQDTLSFYCRDDSMLVSYVYETYWAEWITKEREINASTTPVELYLDLETILASQSNSDGYLKGNDPGRYPLTIPGNHDGWATTRNVTKSKITPSRLLKSYYKFGVHKFFVGRAIKRILAHIEERYGIDFKELERHRRQS